MKGSACECGHHRTMPVIVILFGLTFLLKALGTLDAGTVDYIWPILVIIAGCMKWGGMKCKCC